ncbi:bcl-2-like protein 12 [Carettochelys insculpta]|uniref:bcl-2-like protein 12 n=1 Tax=Carettochelys insculpta TaxID=44489 RepID=UPI003EBB64A4
MAGSPPPRRQLREETRLVLEAFLRRRPPSGHVGHQCFVHSCPPEPEAAPPPGGPRTPLHKEICPTEEHKHGFKTSLKRLLRLRQPSPLRDPHGPSPPRTEPHRGPEEVGDGQGHPTQCRAFSGKASVHKKGPPQAASEALTPCSARPSSLPLSPCFSPDTVTSQPGPQPQGRAAKDPEFYTRVAHKLDQLVMQQLSHPGSPCRTQSPGVMAGPLSLELGPSPPAPPEPQPPMENPKEQVIQRLVALLEEQAGVINTEIEADPWLRRSLACMSYGSFSRLAEAYTARAAPGSPSPRLAQLALSMELTRKVAGINSHATQTLMGYSLQYMDMFVPWLQQQGGWESIVGQDESPD